MQQKIYPSIPPRSNRNSPQDYSIALHKQRNPGGRIFKKLKDCRRIALTYGECADFFSSGI
jgi:hypothetical protein